MLRFSTAEVRWAAPWTDFDVSANPSPNACCKKLRREGCPALPERGFRIFTGISLTPLCLPCRNLRGAGIIRLREESWGELTYLGTGDLGK